MNPTLIKKIIEFSKYLTQNIDSSQRHFTYIIQRNKIICYGVNETRKTHPYGSKYGHRFAARHSEIAAIVNFPYKPAELAGFTLVNVRMNRRGMLMLSKPCSFCQKMLIDFGIYRLYYSTNSEEFVLL